MLVKIAILVSVISIVSTGLILYLLPSDYFIKPRKSYLIDPLSYPKLFRIIQDIRKSLAYLLIALGVIMLVLPGEGLVTIVLGLVVLNKRDTLLKLLSFRVIQKSLNIIRLKMGKKPFLYP